MLDFQAAYTTIRHAIKALYAADNHTNNDPRWELFSNDKMFGDENRIGKSILPPK